LTSELLTKDAS